MLVYVAIYICIILIAIWTEKEKNNTIKKFLKFLLIFLPAFFAGIRYNVGTDYSAIYYPAWYNLKYRGWTEERFELGYQLINKIGVMLNTNFCFVMFICAFITMFFVVKAIDKYNFEKKYFFAIFTYLFLFYQLSFNAVRQAMAMAIFLYATTFLKNNKYKYCFWILFGSLFHSTILFMLILVFLEPILYKHDKRKEFYILLLVLIGIALNLNLVSKVLLKIPGMAQYSPYLRYTGDKFGIGVLARIFPFVLFSFFTKKEYIDDENRVFVTNMIWIGGVFRIFAYITSNYLERIAYYFLIFEILIPDAYCKKTVLKPIIVKVFFIILIIFFWYFDYFYLGIHETEVYKTIFEYKIL